MPDILSYIFTVDFAFSVFRVTTPILFAALASVVAENSGASNIALEGIMLSAALAGAIGSGFFQSATIGFLCAIGGGLIITALLIYFGIFLKTNIVLSGIALNTLATGGTVFFMYVILGDKGGTSSIPTKVFPSIQIPLLNRIPVIGDIISGQNLMTYLAFIMVAAVYVLMYKTRLGMHIRSVGENPDAAASVGISIVRTRVTALLISGALASMGGAFLSMGYMSGFTRDMVSGRGFIALAAAAMGMLSPVPTMISSLIFGFADAFSNILAAMRIPDEFVKMIPYAVTVIGLVIFAIIKRQQDYRRRLRAVTAREGSE